MTKKPGKRAQVAKLRAMREVKTKGEDIETVSVADCEVILDLVISEWFDKGQRPASELSVAELAEYGRLSVIKRTLFAHAVSIALLESSKQWIEASWGNWRKTGLLTRSDHVEVHFHCVFCKDNLATLSRSGRQIPAPFMRKLDRHVHECAMRFLMRVIAEQA